MHPPRGTFLCRLADIPDPGARGFVFGEDVQRFELFVLRRGALIRAYVNRCPHAGWPLESFPDRFLTADLSHILCSGHGALFRPEDGYCLSGPCQGAHLTALSLTIADGDIRLD